MGYNTTPRHDFYVWSPEHGGCIMLTRYLVGRDGQGRRVNWSSHCEGEYPVCDERARAKVASLNTDLYRNPRNHR